MADYLKPLWIVAAALAMAPAWTPVQAQSNSREIVLQLDKRTISLREGGKVLGSWPVAIGDPSTPTPLGRFSVQNKVVNPKYQSTKSGKINATVPKDREPEQVTMDEAVALIAARDRGAELGR